MMVQAMQKIIYVRILKKQGETKQIIFLVCFLLTNCVLQ